MIRAVIFDLDGVLVDSEYHSCSATAELLSARGIPMTEAEVRRLFLGRPIAAVYEHARALGHELPESFAREKEDLYFAKAERELRAFDGAREIAERLRAPKAIASSGSPRKVAFSLATTRLGELFDVVCTTAEVQRGKPAPDLFLHTAERLGVPATECAVIEDSEAGVAAARAAGAFAIGITTTLSHEALTTAGANVVIDSIRELPDLMPHLFS
jgi:HAD superfamily hydrolase (TIGR01509 family)